MENDFSGYNAKRTKYDTNLENGGYKNFIQIPMNKGLIPKNKYNNSELFNSLLLLSAYYDVFKSLYDYNYDEINDECDKYAMLSVTFTKIEANDYLNMSAKTFARARKILVDEKLLTKRTGQTYYIAHNNIRKNFMKLPKKILKNKKLNSFDKIIYCMIAQHKNWDFGKKRNLSDIARMIKSEKIKRTVYNSVKKLQGMNLVIETQHPNKLTEK